MPYRDHTPTVLRLQSAASASLHPLFDRILRPRHSPPPAMDGEQDIRALIVHYARAGFTA